MAEAKRAQMWRKIPIEGLFWSLGCLNFCCCLSCDLLRCEHNHRFTHLLSRLKLYYCPGRNWNIRGWRIRIAPDTGFAHFDFKNAKVSQFDFLTLGYSFRDVIKSLLDNVQNLLLHQAC